MCNSLTVSTQFYSETKVCVSFWPYLYMSHIININKRGRSLVSILVSRDLVKIKEKTFKGFI